jgi:FtsP/CotA-like multicopper oxidase with cupredoxin domain
MPRHYVFIGCITAAAALGLAAAPGLQRPAHAPLPVVQPNDNRQPSGRLHADTLDLDLEVRLARWYPEGDGGGFVESPAFAEAGRAPSIPGPLIRVPAATIVRVTVRNSLADSTVTLHGLVTRPAPGPDTTRLAPGESRVVTFAAGSPGTYFYWGEVGTYRAETNRLARVREREQLAGALIVDEPGPRTDDRIFVMNVWGEPADSESYRSTLTINGRAWPHTERIAATLGDSLRWRVINTSARGHPMHLHGFYYRIAAVGTSLASRPVPTGERPLIVTHEMRAFQTMDMVWLASRAGNWLFHCHVAFHVVPEARLEPRHDRHDELSPHAGEHMAGLVLGISIHDPAPGAQRPAASRALRLLVHEGRPRGRAPRAMAFVLQRDASPPRSDSLEIPGSTLVLTRDQPTTITVVNRLREATSVHWHGIELESYWDGVAGWSGAAERRAPVVAPGDSFIARLTLPRAGTFMYHTHLNDIEQLTSGLYGAIVVLEPGQRWDPATDHVMVIGWDGNFDPPQFRLDGDSAPPPLALAAGRTHRLRIVNIGAAGVVTVTLWQDTTLAAWRAVAKDGADLPPALQTERPARQPITVGETYDFAFTAPAPGTYVLRATGPVGRPVVRPVVVR